MPKAIRFNALGGPEVLKIEDIAPREPGAGEVAIAVAAVGLNRVDSMFYHGQSRDKARLPSGVGVEAVGTVTAVGPGGDAGLIGKRVGILPGVAASSHPVLAEQAIVPAAMLAAVPEALSDIEAAAVWVQYATAYGALIHYGKIAAGEFALITAASSSVGLAAIQIVKAQGGMSIATTRTAKKRDELRRLGADHVIVTEDEDLPERIRQITGGKLARIVFDAVGGDYINVLGQATAAGGSIFLYGLLSGKPAPYPMSIFARDIGMFGYSVYQIMRGEPVEAIKKYVYDHLADGTFKPTIAKSFSFAQTVEAYRYLESNEQVGKIVITF